MTITPCPLCQRGMRDGKHIDTSMGEKCGAKNNACDWKFERWDGKVVGCNLRADHTPIVPWPHHAPTDSIIKPWKRIGGLKVSGEVGTANLPAGDPASSDRTVED